MNTEGGQPIFSTGWLVSFCVRGLLLSKKIMEIRDSRDKEWFWLDNEYLNGYAKLLGSSCTVVYISLCRHANNKTQKCFPSMEKIAEENGISRRTVSRAIKTLEEWDIIQTLERVDKKTKKRKNNIYTLLSKNNWKKKPCDNKSHGKPCDIVSKSHVTPVPSNKTNINKTNIAKENLSPLIEDIIHSFEEVNPACKRMYGNKTQRQACTDLIETYGLEEVKKVIAILPKTNKLTYMPSITTPHLLWTKYQDLKNKLQQKKEQLSSKKVKII